MTDKKTDIKINLDEKCPDCGKPGTVNGCWMPTCVFRPEARITREMLIDAFAAENIDSRVFFWPLTSTGLIDSRFENIVSRSLSGRAINLPAYHDMSEGDQDRVIDVMEKIVSRRNAS